MSGEHQSMEEHGSDAEVIAASLDAPSVFGTVYDRHAGALFRFLVRRVGHDNADPLLGDVFRIAFERRATFDCSYASARPWLYGIATNVLAKHRRTEARRLRATAELAASRATSTPRDDASDDIADAVDAATLWPSVADAIAALPDGERDALLLYVWEDLSYDEIAAALAIPVGTVRSRLNRARARLRELDSARGEQRERITP
ncbi:MAG TPA: RNA polymerase sigma factor [Acidimicrobiales bacterium]|nr:RNA polymerase sigma factor [Acidimicrobiales bacterium]